MGNEILFVGVGVAAIVGVYAVWRLWYDQEQRLHPPVKTSYGELLWNGEQYSMLRFKDGLNFKVTYSGGTIQPSEIAKIESLLSGIDPYFERAIEFAHTREWPEGCVNPKPSELGVSPGGDFALAFECEWPHPGIAMKVSFRDDQPCDFSWRWLENSAPPRYGA